MFTLFAELINTVVCLYKQTARK